MNTISIIVPVYNGEVYLEKCLDSLVMQTLKDFEIIVINNGSSDGSAEIIENYQEKYPGIISTYYRENKGVGPARNLGIEKASGKYIGFLDCDDYVEADGLEKAYLAAIEHDADLVTFNAMLIDGSTYEEIHELKSGNTFESVVSASVEKDLMFRILPSPWSKIYRKDIIKDIKYPENVPYDDAATTPKIIVKCEKIFNLDYPVVNYLINRTGNETSSVDKRLMYMIQSMNIINEHFNDKGLFDKYYRELEFYNIKHLFDNLLKLKQSNDQELINKLVKETFELLDKQFPKWKSNKHLKNERQKSMKTKFVWKMLFRNINTFKIYLRLSKLGGRI